jgi:Family of unknown function (DUF6519)
MTIDRARDSYAPARDWRSVLAQQGRVTLEADVNEQARILTENQRVETIDVIGPIGTPDGGYTVTASGGDVAVGPGTIYVGGWRLTSDVSILSAQQPLWLDMPPWPQSAGNQIVGLLVTEQSVVAVEDEALREVALGGPDTSGRLRLLQHVVRVPTSAGDCASAAAALPGLLLPEGLTYDPSDCSLTSTATLQVTLVQPSTPATQCDPPVQGGYLGADNQMIHIAVTDFDTSTGAGHLVWSLNNSSFLFRAVPGLAGQVTFLAPPLDSDHTPQQGQAVEVLRCTVDLLDGDRSKPGGGNFIAAGFGDVMVLGATPFAPASNTLTLPSALGFNDGARPVFVRLWEAQIPFIANTAATLGNTGLAVTIANPQPPSPIWGRPYWEFAVRPLTPTLVYPAAILAGPQPPSGPRQFLAPLGVVGWNDGVFSLLEDCSMPFVPLTQLHDCSCCSLVLDPTKDWLSTLNIAIGDQNVTTLSICFQPGEFDVTKTITITGKTVRMTGAGPGAGTGAGSRLVGSGLEVVLEFVDCPVVGLSDFAVVAETAGWGTSATVGLQGAVTVQNCHQVDIERLDLTCADADLRSLSCLKVYNDVPAAGAPPEQYNLRVLNSQFHVGNSQVGILAVNADRAQIEGNLVVNQLKPLGITYETLGRHKAVAFQLRRQLIEGLKLTGTAAPTKRARARARKRQAIAARAKAAATQAPAAPPSGAQSAAPPQAAVNPAPVRVIAAKPELGAFGRAHVRTTIGAVQLEFISSARLGNAWNEVLRAQIPAGASLGTIHATVKNIATNAMFNASAVPPAFSNWVAATLPLLYSISSQGIVVGGDIANDVRIVNNTVDGTVQGIHVGLSDIKKYGKGAGHLSAARVQIRGNTVNIRLTANIAGDRHGIFVGCVKSAVVVENHLQLTRYPNARSVPRWIDGIKVEGSFGPFVVIERNCMLGFNDGVDFVSVGGAPSGAVWTNLENYSG